MSVTQENKKTADTNNPSENVLEIITKISQLSATEIVELTSCLQEKFGISDDQLVSSSGSADGSQGGNSEEQAEEQKFNVVIQCEEADKIKAIKAVKDLGFGLKEAKDLVVQAINEPVKIKEGLQKQEADAIVKTLSVCPSIKVKLEN